ncbi:MAG: hypothetical protein WD825_17175 [Gemmatimonadaceae bacterium]
MTRTSAIPVYTGELRELRHLLLAGAVAEPAKWQRWRLARAIVGGSLLVAVRLRPDKNRWELCIGRDVAPQSLVEKSRWEGEVRRIQRELGAGSWHREADVFSGEAIAATFTTPINKNDLQHGLDFTTQ